MAWCRRSRRKSQTGAVLTLAWMNREALSRTAATGESRTTGRARASGCGTRARRSGHVQRVREIRLDCDNDAILLDRRTDRAESPVIPAGTAAFFSGSRTAPGVPSSPCSRIRRLSMARHDDDACNVLRRRSPRTGTPIPVQSYVATLFAKGDDAILKKIGEEATEAVMAAKDGDKIRLTAETRGPLVPLPGAARAHRPWTRRRARRAGAARRHCPASTRRPRAARRPAPARLRRLSTSNMDNCIFCKIVRGEIPVEQGLRGRRDPRVPRHPSAGAGAFHDDPEEAHRFAGATPTTRHAACSAGCSRYRGGSPASRARPTASAPSSTPGASAGRT